MKGGSNIGPPPSPEITTLKRLSLIGVNTNFARHCALMKTNGTLI